MPKNVGHNRSSKIMPGGFKLYPFFDLGHKKCPLGNHDLGPWIAVERAAETWKVLPDSRFQLGIVMNMA